MESEGDVKLQKKTKIAGEGYLDDAMISVFQYYIGRTKKNYIVYTVVFQVS